jgi:hypothetical protein
MCSRAQDMYSAWKLPVGKVTSVVLLLLCLQEWAFSV